MAVAANLSWEESGAVLNAIMTCLREAVTSGLIVTLSDFGTFMMSQNSPHQTPALHFIPDPQLLTLLDTPVIHLEAS